MTNDLISREAAVKLLCDKADGYYVSMFATSDECHVARIVALEAANEIESIPTVDAKTVVHGRWENIANYGCGNCYGYCSECRSEVRAENATALKMANNFCPHCGAKMDKEE